MENFTIKGESPKEIEKDDTTRVKVKTKKKGKNLSKKVVVKIQ